MPVKEVNKDFMSLKILIVEDHFVEANDLRIILESAGHEVCGIANSVNKALKALEEIKPDIVLVDIFLQGELTGIDLARSLAKFNIPFIYLSANSNPSTLEKATTTRPYGFLVKPYREPEILAALEIASYRHNHQMELMRKQEEWLNSLLTNILTEDSDANQKIISTAKAIQPFINFDYIVLEVSYDNSNKVLLSGFHRIENNEFISVPELDFLTDEIEYKSGERDSTVDSDPVMEPVITDTANIDSKAANKLNHAFNNIFNAPYSLYLPVLSDGIVSVSIRLFSTLPSTFSIEHIDLLNANRSVLSQLMRKIVTELIVNGKGISGIEKSENEDALTEQFSEIIGKSPDLLFVLNQVKQVAPFDTTILVCGETGTGKEGIVKAIHRLSARKLKPMVKINCAAIPSGLIESELFGHERGAFTGATDRKIGKFEQANGGTIFLDEIGEIPLDVQAKLLRVLQEKEIERVGGRTTIKTDVRIIAATNRNLHKEVADGNFRIDLFYRINVFPMEVPPLRNRKSDVPLLVNHFLLNYSKLAECKLKTISQAALQKLCNYDWPGNVRELQHVIERNVLINKQAVITNIELPEQTEIEKQVQVAATSFETIKEVEKRHILSVIKSCNGKINGKGGAAEILDLPPTTLNLKMKKLGIVWQHIFK